MLALGAGAAAAQTAAQAAAPATRDPFEQMMAAQGVADFGRRTKDPQALIVAARMLQEIPVTDGAAGAPAEAATAGAFTAEGLFAEAGALAGSDPVLLAQIRLAQSSGRGVLSSAFGRGLVRIVHDVAARASYTFPIKARGGERLRVGAIGGSKSRMVMRMRDSRAAASCAPTTAATTRRCARSIRRPPATIGSRSSTAATHPAAR